ncbi:MAG TPA: hypothetical protein VD886_24225 [Herpetosiphonaceae bacterium]|nr:hypothetical protein [Herpetosiphonaceae bacterium]
MLKRYRMALAALLMVLVVLPAAAAERVDALPAVKAYNSSRFEQLLTINGIPLITGRGEMESNNRLHYVLKTVPSSGLDEETLEIVVYDGTMYTRENADTQWYIEDSDVPIVPPSGDIPAEANLPFPVTKIGTVNVAGTPTDQYQIWIQDAAMGDLLKFDLWIGQQMNYIYQEQLAIVTTDPELGELTLADLHRAYDFDAAIKVGPPANAKVRPNPTSLTNFSWQNRGLNKLAAPFVSSFVRDAAIARFAR